MYLSINNKKHIMKKQLSKTVVDTIKDNKGTGLLALAGIGLGVLAFFGYKRIPQEKKDAFKEKLGEAGQKVKETYNELESKIKHQAKGLEKDAQEKIEKATA
ncbi:MAG: hypothetical protein CL868_15410 [Cytophagaceae bacterium]|nr:hypothetical protein [Cytophagaceae bacterium]